MDNFLLSHKFKSQARRSTTCGEGERFYLRCRWAVHFSSSCCYCRFRSPLRATAHGTTHKVQTVNILSEVNVNLMSGSILMSPDNAYWLPSLLVHQEHATFHLSCMKYFRLYSLPAFSLFSGQRWQLLEEKVLRIWSLVYRRWIDWQIIRYIVTGFSVCCETQL